MLKPSGSDCTTIYNGDCQIYSQQTPTLTSNIVYNNGGRLLTYNAAGTATMVYTQGPDGRAISQKENQ